MLETDARTPSFRLVAGDTVRRLRIQLLDGQQRPINITQAQRVKVRIRPRVGTITAVHDCIIESATAGIVSHAFPNGSTDIPGDYLVQFEVTWDVVNDRKETFPQGHYSNMLMRIEPKV